MQTFSDLPEHDQALAIEHALAILGIDSDAPSQDEARALAEAAHYPEPEDQIIFLTPLISTDDLADLDAEVIELLFSQEGCNAQAA